MEMVRGTHVQASSGRAFCFRAMFEPVSGVEVFFACTISEPNKGIFGSLERGSTFEGTVPIGPDCVPVELALRSRAMSYIERTDFGDWRPPPPSWIGWYGPI